jgi:hypothetical protein
MMAMSDGQSVFSHQTKRQIALACRDHPRTIGDLSRTLGRDDGSIRGTVLSLRDDGVLLTRRVAHSAAEAYRLNRRYRKQLDDAVGGRAPPGQMTRGQRLIFVSGTSVAAVTDALRSLEGHPAVEWAARLHGAQLHLLIAIDPVADVALLDQVTAKIETAGAERVVAVVDQVLGIAELPGYTRTVAGRGELSQGSTS